MKILKTFLSVALFSFAFAGAAVAADAPSETKPAACCAKASADGKTCTHACCVEAAEAGKNCEKCGGKGTTQKKS
jgi:hypothetical protein